MKKAYNILFYKFYCFWKSVSDDGWSDWKAYIAVNTLGILLLVELLVWLTLIFKTIVNLPKYWFAIPVAVTVVLLNYYMFLHQERWKEYEEEFRKYSRTKNNIISLSVLGFCILILGSLIFSFYQMSLVDWAKYR